MSEAAPHRAVLERLLPRFVRAFAPCRIVLFGSYAKGTQHPGSDIDLLLVCDQAAEPLQAHRRARQLAADCFPHVDVAFASAEEVALAPMAASPFLQSILENGVTVYESKTARA
jgi:uncharacterized protein